MDMVELVLILGSPSGRDVDESLIALDIVVVSPRRKASKSRKTLTEVSILDEGASICTVDCVVVWANGEDTTGLLGSCLEAASSLWDMSVLLDTLCRRDRAMPPLARLLEEEAVSTGRVYVQS